VRGELRTLYRNNERPVWVRIAITLNRRGCLGEGGTTTGRMNVRHDPKIAIAATGLGHVARGIEAWAADLGKALNARGHRVILCKGGGDAVEPYERRISCWQRNAPRTRRLLKILPGRLFWRLGLGSGYDVEQTTFALALLKHLRREQVDVLHVQDPRLAMLVQRARGLGLVRTRTILAHGTEEPTSFLNKIDYLQHLAPWHLQDCREAGAWKPQWTAIPNFIDTDTFNPAGPSLREELNIPTDATVILTAAALKRQHKRIDYLIEEFGVLIRRAPSSPLYLIVAGGWERDTEELVRLGTSRLGDRVRFLVRFPRERMADLYRTANVFALCSLKEMMPIALLEATASGLPCVINRHPVLEWMAGPGGTSIDMAAPGALASALQSLVAEPGRMTELGRRARQYCIENFSRDRVVDRIVEYYRYVVADGSPEPCELRPEAARS